jgi:type I restriction enzyme R subunit
MLSKPKVLPNTIKIFNDTYGLNLSEEDKVDLVHIPTRLEEDESLQAVIQAYNPIEVVRYKFDNVVDDILLEFSTPNWIV